MIIGAMNSSIAASTDASTDASPLATPAPSGALRLADWGLIRARGADAASFLHGQLTQDVTALSTSDARLAGYCSAKGRLLASFVLWRSDDDSIDLACSADLLPPTLKRLSMFVLRAKCKLSDVSAEVALYGLAGAEATAWLGDGAPARPGSTAAVGTGRAVRLPDAAGQARYLLAWPADAPAPALPALAADDWRWLEIKSGVVRIVAATVEQFVPQRVNLELVGGVNFQKGCYPGQEIVARSQYRGTLKRRVMAFDSDAPLAAGQEVFHSADPGQPAGLVALAAARPGGGSSALVEIKLAALDGGSLHAGAADGPLLARGTLPYAIPVDAA
jgi:folate-binding protein YgfZ